MRVLVGVTREAELRDRRSQAELGNEKKGSVQMDEAYAIAQRAMADLKAAVYVAIQAGPAEGLRNVDIGRMLGIYAGHVEHVGHIPRTILALMENEGVVQQDRQSMRWKLRQHSATDSDE
jgi:hypothetical protein